MTIPPSVVHGQGPVISDAGYFLSGDGTTRLFWRSARPQDLAVKAHLAVVPGYCDHSGRYLELMNRAAKQGYSAHAVDLRGHGQSDGRRTHVQAFRDYCEDLDSFMSLVDQEAKGLPTFLLGHSMGAVVCACWAAKTERHPKGMILSSPFAGFAFVPPRLKVLAARVLNRLAPWMLMANPLSPTQLTRDLELQKATSEDPLYLHTVTPRWYCEILGVQAGLRGLAAKVNTPTLVLLGSEDPVAAPSAGKGLFEALGSVDKSIKIYDGMLHEVLNEIDRGSVYEDLFAWIEGRL